MLLGSRQAGLTAEIVRHLQYSLLEVTTMNFKKQAIKIVRAAAKTTRTVSLTAVLRMSEDSAFVDKVASRVRKYNLRSKHRIILVR